MSSVVPPPATPVPTQAGAAPAPTATVPNPPAALTELPVGSTLNAQLLAQPRPNVAEVQTNLGTLLLHTNVKLPEGTSFQLQICTLVPQLQVLLNALPPGQAATAQPGQAGAAPQAVLTSPGAVTPAAAQQAGQATAQTGSTLQSITADGQVKLDIGAVLKATVVRLPGAGAAGQRATSVPTSNLSSAAPSGPAPVGAGPAAPAGTPSSQTPLTGPAVGTTVASTQTTPPSSGLQVGQQIDVRILGIVPRGQIAGQTGTPSPAITSLQAGQTFQGSVTAATRAGQPVVDTPIGQLILDTKSPIPLGSRLSLEVVSTPGQAGFQHQCGDHLRDARLASPGRRPSPYSDSCSWGTKSCRAAGATG